MIRVPITFALFTVCALSSCSALRPNTSEAEGNVRSEFEQSYSKCGDSYFANNVPWGLVQFKDVTFNVKQLDLSDADKLNNVEWKGAATVSCQLTRLYNYGTRKWSDWSSKNPLFNPDGTIVSYIVEKRQDQWKLRFLGGQVGQKVECDRLPK